MSPLRPNGKPKFPEAIQFSYNPKPFATREKAIEALTEKNLRPGEPAQVYYYDSNNEIHSFLALGAFSTSKTPLIIEGDTQMIENIANNIIGNTGISIDPTTGENTDPNAPSLPDYIESGDLITTISGAINYLILKQQESEESQDWIILEDLV